MVTFGDIFSKYWLTKSCKKLNLFKRFFPFNGHVFVAEIVQNLTYMLIYDGFQCYCAFISSIAESLWSLHACSRLIALRLIWISMLFFYPMSFFSKPYLGDWALATHLRKWISKFQNCKISIFERNIKLTFLCISILFFKINIYCYI